MRANQLSGQEECDVEVNVMQKGQSSAFTYNWLETFFAWCVCLWRKSKSILNRGYFEIFQHFNHCFAFVSNGCDKYFIGVCFNMVVKVNHHGQSTNGPCGSLAISLKCILSCGFYSKVHLESFRVWWNGLQQHRCQKGNWLLKEINPSYCEFKREVKKKYPCLKSCKACHVIIICGDSYFTFTCHRMSQDNVKTSFVAQALVYPFVYISVLPSILMLAV